MIVFLKHLYVTDSKVDLPESSTFLFSPVALVKFWEGVMSRAKELWSLSCFDHAFQSVTVLSYHPYGRVKPYHSVKGGIPNFHFCKASCIVRLME